MRWMDWIRRWFGDDRKKTDKPVKNQKATIRKLLVLALVGVALLAGSRMLSGESENEKADSRSVFSSKDARDLSEIKSNMSKDGFTFMDQYETYINQNLKNILEQIQGVSDVSVMVTFSSSGKKIYQNNVKTQDNQTVESDQKGGKREITERNEDSQVVMIDKEGSKEPVVIGEEQPTVRGVIVVASGADQPAVQVQIMEAVATVLDIPTYKVKVLQKSE
ncbi:stage III sporulation protein AG [Sporolactobacillus sp. THM7-7]|nr:stage III sporulation protein AG [Sporolactobacillus sp. THM7-7]